MRTNLILKKKEREIELKKEILKKKKKKNVAKQDSNLGTANGIIYQ
jgi:hypothetical protein